MNFADGALDEALMDAEPTAPDDDAAPVLRAPLDEVPAATRALGGVPVAAETAAVGGDAVLDGEEFAAVDGDVVRPAVPEVVGAAESVLGTTGGAAAISAMAAAELAA